METGLHNFALKGTALTALFSTKIVLPNSIKPALVTMQMMQIIQP